MINSIKFKAVFSNGRSIENEATFESGSTLITGKNGRGKSMFLEMASFALFGTDALRGLASEYKSLNVDLSVTIRGTTYEVHRTKSNADVSCKGEPLAAGTRPVNEWVERTLGYGYEVYRVAHWCAQGDIQALADMKPAERKKMIDDVAGLTQLDGLYGFISEQVKLHRATILSLQANQVRPIEPTAPDAPSREELAEFGNELDSLQLHQARLQAKLVKPVLPVAPVAPIAPAPMAAPVAPTPLQNPEPPVATTIEAPVLEELLAPVGYQAEQLPALVAHKAQLQAVVSTLPQLRKKLEGLSDTFAAQPDRETLVLLHNARQWRSELERLSKAGMSACPKCGHEHAIHAHRIEELEALLKDVPAEGGRVLSSVEGYDLLVTQLEEAKAAVAAAEPKVAELAQVSEVVELWSTYARLLADQQQILRNYEQQKLQAEHYYNSAMASWRTQCERVAAQNEQMAEQYAQQLASHEAACQRQQEHYDQQLAAYEAQQCQYQAAMQEYQNQLDSYQAVEAELTALDARYSIGVAAYVRTSRQQLDHYKAQWTTYDALMARYAQDVRSYQAVEEQIKDEQAKMEDLEKARKGLNDTKMRVQSYLVPSLSRVASFLVGQMTANEIGTVVIDDNFDVFVDGQSLRTLSGAGKDVVNLALRIGLGRVLTHRVLPVMMLDEIDAAMDEDRAGHTWECIQRITPQIGQVVQVSHKQLKAERAIVV